MIVKFSTLITLLVLFVVVLTTTTTFTQGKVKNSCNPSSSETTLKEKIRFQLQETTSKWTKSKGDHPFVHQFSEPGKCKIGGKEGKLHASYPIYSLQHLGISPGTSGNEPSPFWNAAYLNSAVQESGFFIALMDKLESIPIFGSVSAAIKLPLVMFFTHGTSFLKAGPVVLTSGLNWKKIEQAMHPQTVSLLRFFKESMSLAMARQAIFVTVKDASTRKTISPHETNPSSSLVDLNKVLTTVAVALPKGVKSCDEIDDPFSLKDRKSVV